MTLPIKKLAIAILVLVSAYSSLSFLAASIQAWNPRLITHDGVYDWDARLSGLRAALPRDVNAVGYIADWDVLPRYNYADNETEYVLTQYAMAPVVVTRGAQAQWVIVNLKPKDYQAWIASQPSSLQVKEYGPGLYLVHKP